MIAGPEEYRVSARHIDFDTGAVTWIEFVSNTIPRPAPGQTIHVTFDEPGEEPFDKDVFVYRLDALDSAPSTEPRTNHGN